MKDEKETLDFIESIDKIRELLEKYPSMGFYINQISETVQIDKSKVERILDEAKWVNKKGKRYYYLPVAEDVWKEILFCEDIDNEVIDFDEENEYEIGYEKLELLKDPEKLIQLLKKERDIF
ncbi:MAG: hypothetical protein RR705_06685 [Lachnospiraceae bacterium]